MCAIADDGTRARTSERTDGLPSCRASERADARSIVRAGARASGEGEGRKARPVNLTSKTARRIAARECILRSTVLSFIFGHPHGHNLVSRASLDIVPTVFDKNILQIIGKSTSILVFGNFESDL